jgi:hypothetical protein
VGIQVSDSVKQHHLEEHHLIIMFQLYEITGLSANLYERGFRNITNIDISPVVINQMSDTYADLEEMECKFDI